MEGKISILGEEKNNKENYYHTFCFSFLSFFAAARGIKLQTFPSEHCSFVLSIFVVVCIISVQNNVLWKCAKNFQFHYYKRTKITLISLATKNVLTLKLSHVLHYQCSHILIKRRYNNLQYYVSRFRFPDKANLFYSI